MGGLARRQVAGLFTGEDVSGHAIDAIRVHRREQSARVGREVEGRARDGETETQASLRGKDYRDWLRGLRR